MELRQKILKFLSAIVLCMLSALPSFGAEPSPISDDSPKHVRRRGPQEVELSSDKRLRIYTTGDKTFALLIDGKTKQKQKLALSRGPYADPNGTFGDFSYLGQYKNGAVVITETYHTNARPTGYCGAGEERMLQVLETKPKLREALAVKIESCIDTIELESENGVALDHETNSLSIHRLLFRDSQDECKTYNIAGDGAAKETSTVTKKIAD